MQSVFLEIERINEVLRLIVVSHPDEVIVGVSALVAGLCVLMLMVARRAEQTSRELETARRQIVVLQQENLDLRSEGIQVQEHGERPAVASQPPGVEPVAILPEAPREQETTPVAEMHREESALTRGLRKSRAGLLGRLAAFFSGKNAVEGAMLDDLEEVLILSDVGARCASELVESVRQVAQGEASVSQDQLRAMLKEGIRGRLIEVPETHRMYRPVGEPMVVLVVGVNGVGKTTTVAKLAATYVEQGKRVMVIAADTFRAAAVQQLEEWARRVNFTVVKGPEGTKPGAVVFDGMASAKEQGFDVVLIDTAGRLHTKSNLMQELEGVRNSIRKHIPEAPHETVLVVDGVSGQNALAQAREFNAAVPLTGIIVTKLDGTPRGGIIVAISQELKVPVLYIGVGEKQSDLIRFDPSEFVTALLEESPNSNESGALVQAAINQ